MLLVNAPLLGAADATTTASATTASPAPLDTVLPAALSADARADLATVHAGTIWGDGYRPDVLIATAHRLHLAGRDRALTALKTYAAMVANSVYSGHDAAWCSRYNTALLATGYDCNRVVLLCHLLFAGDNPDGIQGLAGEPFPAYATLLPSPTQPAPPRLLADYPLLIVQGFPFVLIRHLLSRSSFPPAPGLYAVNAIDYAERHCHWKAAEDVPQGDPLAADIAVAGDTELLGAYDSASAGIVVALVRAQTYQVYAPMLTDAERARLAGPDWNPTHPAGEARWQAFQAIAYAHPVAWDPTTYSFVPSTAK
jgi:hypothetical protein